MWSLRRITEFYIIFFFNAECFNETEAKNTDDKRGSEGTEEKGKEGEDKNKDTDEDRERKKSGKEKKKGKGKEKDKNKGGKTSARKSKRSSQAEEDDSEKIQRLIRQQAQEQEEHRKKRGRTKEFVGGKMDERKRREFQTRLRDIHDVDRLRRELRRIRQREMTEDDYSAREPWERHMDSSIPEEVRRDMRRHRFERMNDPEDLRRELRMRAMDLDDDDHFFEEHSFAFRELSHRYMIEAEEIRDPLELKKRIDDLDALSAIFSSGYERDRRRGRHGRRPWKDEFWRVGAGHRKFFIFSSPAWNSDTGTLSSRERNKLVFTDSINLVWGYEFQSVPLAEGISLK